MKLLRSASQLALASAFLPALTIAAAGCYYLNGGRGNSCLSIP